MTEQTKKVVRIAVRWLVEQAYMSGSLGVDFASTDRAVEGTAGHRKIQKSRPEGYATEVPISYSLDTPYFILELTGRIDGVFENANPVVIEELKTTLQDLDMFVIEENPVHWAQLKLYAYCYAKEHGLGQVTGQLTYYHLETGETREIKQAWTITELEKFFRDILGRYLKWANKVEEWRMLRDESIRNMAFPFKEYRAGQRQMAVDVYLAVKQGEQALVQAPTGIGKTMAALFPAVKALSEGHTEKLFYLTARNTGKMAAEDALTRLRQDGLRLKAVTITAKEKACFSPSIYCQTDNCEFAQGYYDRVGDAVTEAFELDELTREAIEEIARKHRICPFEFSLDLSLWTDCIICDYNYAFDPRVYLRRYFQNVTGAYTFLIDEAHNMVDRARDMFSAELSKHDLYRLRSAVKTEIPKMYRQLGRINRWFNQAGKQCRERGEAFAETEKPESLLPLLEKFNDDAKKWLANNIPAPFRKDLLDRFFEVNWFLTVADRYDESYATCYDNEWHDMHVKLFCLDPAIQMEEALQRARSTVFFSATLTPMDYFKNLFGCRPEVRQRTFPSPFPPENLCLLLMPDISTLYKKREETVSEVAEMIHETVSRKQGNYLLFFPSYAYMQMVHDEFITREPDTDILLQAPSMTEEERADFLERFSSENGRTLVGFAVMGGIFGEGIDLVGDRLTGAVIVGVGLPAVCLERDLIRDHFEQESGNGFEYAYVYPGLTRVLQAAGRVIRTEQDRGVVALIDKRFAGSRYRNLFPKEWKPVYITSIEELHQAVQGFWGR
ncbi:MAG: DEAD/DEAH box helicase [Dehalococcoidales bacterium]|nr:DEAD/DEAH box helicase [Dehalococcoidales bacterium]